jgi:hypothetical protein
MAMIQVARDGAKLGEFTPEQVREGLETGQFRATDLGWQPGMTEWRPLSELVTPGVPDQPPAIAAFPSPGAGSGLPWEHREQLGFFTAFFHTVSLLITRPGEAFTRMRLEGGLSGPLLFGLIGGCASYVVSIVFQALLEAIPGYPGSNGILHMFGLRPWMAALILAVLSPVMVLLGLFIGGAVLHLCLMLVGGAKRSFETTMRVVCFSGGSANLFSMIPVCGWVIAVVYTVVLECIGLSRAHETTTGKALLAVLLPLFLCCCAVGVLIAALFGSLGAFAEYFNSRH